MSSGPAPRNANRVLHVVTSTQRRGAETFAVDLATALVPLGMPGEVVALAGSSDSAALAVDVLGRRPLTPPTLRALRRRAGGASVVVGHGSRTLLAGAIALAGTGTPFVYRSIGDPAAWSAQGWRRARTALALRRAAAVVALWPAAADVLHHRHGVARSRLHVLPNGVDGARCPVPDASARASARRRFGLPEDATVIAIAGALSAEKQVEQAIAAVAGLPDAHLLVAGDGERRPQVAAAMGAVLGGRGHLAGSIDDIAAVLAAADVVVLTSRTEGMPGVLIEAGLAARPAVAYDVGAVREVVVDAKTGFVVPPDDVEALRAAVVDALAAAEHLGAAARHHCVEKFEIAAVAARWHDLLATLGPHARGHLS